MITGLRETHHRQQLLRFRRRSLKHGGANHLLPEEPSSRHSSNSLPKVFWNHSLGLILASRRH